MKRLLWNKHTRLILRHLLGWFCILAGLVMLVTPGQGLLTLIMGVYLLADHVPFFGRLKKKLQPRFPKATRYVHQKGEQIKAKCSKSDPS
jgi:hypothetical protein